MLCNAVSLMMIAGHHARCARLGYQPLNISVEHGNLVIQAERHEKEEDKDKKYVVRESSSSFYRSVQLPERADTDSIEAHLDDGILKVTIPVTPAPEPKKISVKSHSKKK